MSTESADLRSRLVRAGREELAAHGHGRLGLRAVARRAGVSHAAPAYSFGNRSGLLTAIVAAGFRELADELDAPIDDADLSDRRTLAVLGRRYVDFARRNPALYELMFQPDELDPADEDLAAARAAALRGLVAATSAAGGAPSDFTLVSWALAHGLATLGIQGALALVGQDASPADLVDAYVTLLAPPPEG